MSKTRISHLALFIAALILIGYWFSHISDAPVGDDSYQTLRMALNLEREGVMSLDVVPPYTPSMYREPFPVWIMALNVKVAKLLFGAPDDPESYFEGDHVRYLKYLNVFWFAALTGSAFWACYLFTSSVFTSTAAALLVNVRLPMTNSGPLALGLNNLYSEQAAAALLMLASSFLVLAIRRGRIRDAALAGLFFGMLALTKAVMLYVFFGLLIALIGLLLPPVRRFLPHRVAWRPLLALVLACGIVVLPWVSRNHTVFNSWQVAERGGVVLYLRAVKNQMTAEEYLGSFFVWAPGLSELWGYVLGFSDEDLREGGRLQRLNRTADADFAERDLAAELAGNPEGAISYYHRARAARMGLIAEFNERGIPNARHEADKILQQRALSMIRQDLGSHLIMTIPFLWRGALTTSIALIGCLAYALARRRTDFVMFMLPASGTVAFYALFSHFISRYNVPFVPIAVVSGLVLLNWLWNSGKTRLLGASTDAHNRKI
jgi:hypothetical protein